MGVPRRQFCSKKLYEICFRAQRGLPLPPRPLIIQLIKSALGRTQRDYKVTICSYVWMGNHVHILVICGDAEEFRNFYGELKKRITDSIKRLLNLKHLSLWEDSGTTAAQILDINEAVTRTVYLFANPASANLVDHIEDYPGLSTWESFSKAPAQLSYSTIEQVPWIHMHTIPSISNLNFSKAEEQRALQSILADEINQELFPLVIEPLAWLKVYGVTDPAEIVEYHSAVIERIKAKEAGLKEARAKVGSRIIGKAKLLSAGISFAHQPVKKERRIFVLTSINELRMEFIARYRAFCAECRECYKLMRLGYRNVEWPPGAFIPPAPILYNSLAI